MSVSLLSFFIRRDPNKPFRRGNKNSEELRANLPESTRLVGAICCNRDSEADAHMGAKTLLRWLWRRRCAVRLGREISERVEAQAPLMQRRWELILFFLLLLLLLAATITPSSSSTRLPLVLLPLSLLNNSPECRSRTRGQKIKNKRNPDYQNPARRQFL